MNHSYEIEIKSLLGGKEKANELLNKMKSADSNLQILGSHKQLNHYFIDGDLEKLIENVKYIIEPEKLEKLRHIGKTTKDYSARTRWADGKVVLVIKASVDDTTSSNGTARLEWESQLPVTIEELDKILLSSGFKYQAKWSRERQAFKFKDLDVTIDKNAGYGYLAEFEKQIKDETKATETKGYIRKLMEELEINELPQDRLERMFAYYNKNWENYYGTDNIFNIE
jgi:adenylate cyclase class IV